MLDLITSVFFFFFTQFLHDLYEKRHFSVDWWFSPRSLYILKQHAAKRVIFAPEVRSTFPFTLSVSVKLARARAHNFRRILASAR